MNVCCIIETPYQLFNALSLLLNDDEFSDASIDMFIRDKHFSSSDVYYQRIKEMRLFRNVHLFDLNYNFSKSNIINHLRNIPKFAFAANTISRAIEGKYKFRKNEYDIILTPNGCVFFKLALICNPKAAVYCFEDGLLSYGGKNWVASDFSSFSKIIIRLFAGKAKYSPQRVYLNSPQFFIRSWDVDVRRLPSIKSVVSSNSIISTIFGSPTCDYSINKVIYLSQPLSNDVSHKITEQISCGFITRYHPRDSKDFSIGSMHDRSSSQWELICASSISDNHILVGACSTAQVAPKWFFDIEPYLVFTYPLYDNHISENFRRISNDIIKKTKQIYRNPHKIFVVNSLKELNSVLEQITQ